MAEESINAPVTPEIIEPDKGNLRKSCVEKPSSPNGGQSRLPDYRRASTSSYHYGGNSRKNFTRKPTTPNNGQNILPHHTRASTGSCHDVANLRNSTGKPSSPNSGETVAPHYLRASTGSCHDFCKHGRKHAFEVKARCPTPKRVIPPSDRQNCTEFGVPADRKTTIVVKAKPSPVSKTLSCDSPSTIKPYVSSSSKKVKVPSRQASSNEEKIAQNEKKNNLSAKLTTVKSKTMTVKPLSSPDTSGDLNSRRNSEVKIAKKTGTSKAAVKKILVSPAASLPPKPFISRVVNLDVKNYRNLKFVSPLKKDQNRIRKSEPKQPNIEKVPEKALRVIKVESQNKVLESAQNGSTIHFLVSPTFSSPNSSSLPKSPALSFHEEAVQEESEYTDCEVDEADDSISESSETVNVHESETSEGNHKRIPRKAGVGLSEDKDCAPAKLKFRRGKVVDIQCENSGPRRLRFRRGRVLGEKQDSKADVRKRSFKKRGGEDDTNCTDIGSEKVVLRHQDVQGKKDAQGLFNNVIEETASKLVESRKSKVKALVGAFETVISLQESKPST